MCERYYDFSKRTVRFGTEQFPRHSEASIIEKNDGGLLMAWQHHTKAVVADCGDQLPSDISIAESYDDGKTWAKSLVIEPGDAGYADIALTEDGTFYVLYEQSAGIRDRLAIFSIDDFQ